MRIEITSTQAGANRALASRRFTPSEPNPHPASWAGAPVAASSLGADPSKSSPFSPSCAIPVPVRWDAVRG